VREGGYDRYARLDVGDLYLSVGCIYGISGVAWRLGFGIMGIR